MQRCSSRRWGAVRAPLRISFCLNTAAALVVAGRAADLRAGVSLAREAIESGAALEKLRALAQLSQTLD